MVDYIALRCPHCKYVWVRREERMPVSCPRCKKRFDYGGNHIELERTEVTSDSYSIMKEWLADANRYSLQCASLDEIGKRIEQQ